MKNRAAIIIFVIAIVLAVFCLRPAPCEGKPSGGPRLLSSLPSDSELVGRDAAVSLSFDGPMDRESLRKAISFDPPVDFSLSGEAECLVVPDNLLRGGMSYTFRLEEGSACDREGEILEQGLEITFSTRNDSMHLEVPSIPFDGDVVEGDDPQGVVSLIGRGIGHYPGTGRPGGGNLVLMAHSSGIISFPFNSMWRMSRGEVFRLEYGGRSYVYSLGEDFVVGEEEVWILEPGTRPMLTVFICCAEDGRPSPTFHPPYRYVARAYLAATTPSLVSME